MHRTAAHVKALKEQVRREYPAAKPIPVTLLRHNVRAALSTVDRVQPPIDDLSVWGDLESPVAALAEQMRQKLTNAGQDEVLLGFPPAPFVLTMTAARLQGIEGFLVYARQHPTHPVRLVHRPANQFG